MPALFANIAAVNFIGPSLILAAKQNRRTSRPRRGKVSVCLEDDFASKLQDSTGTGCQNLTEASAVRVISDRRSNCGAGEGIVPVLMMVEGVKRLSPELERNSLRKFELLANP